MYKGGVLSRLIFSPKFPPCACLFKSITPFNFRGDTNIIRKPHLPSFGIQADLKSRERAKIGYACCPIPFTLL